MFWSDLSCIRSILTDERCIWKSTTFFTSHMSQKSTSWHHCYIVVAEDLWKKARNVKIWLKFNLHRELHHFSQILTTCWLLRWRPSWYRNITLKYHPESCNHGTRNSDDFLISAVVQSVTELSWMKNEWWTMNGVP